MAKVEFVKYNYKDNSLCAGVLYVRIDGVLHTFGSTIDGEQVGEYPSFWGCGGCIDYDYNDVEKGPWELDIYDCDGWDEDMKRNLPELIRIFNENVPWGCCGKCLYF